MKRGATREEIIRTTQDLITRNGIRAVRMDEIAQTLGISKRTLYELFTDKTNLVSACLDDMNHQLHQKIAQSRSNGSGNPLHRTLRLIQDYIDSLYLLGPSFLAEIRDKIAYADQRNEHRSFWRAELMLRLTECRDQQLLLPEVDTTIFARQILDTLLELRDRQTACDELHLLGRTLLRGAASRKGFESFDNNP